MEKKCAAGVILSVVSTAGFPDSVTLFRTAVERANGEVYKLLCTV